MVENQTAGSRRRKWMMSGVVRVVGPHRALVAIDDAVRFEMGDTEMDYCALAASNMTVPNDRRSATPR
jgi:hypothetical protein